jgi:hypothetical protein
MQTNAIPPATRSSAEQFGQPVLVPEPVLDREDRRVVPQQRADERVVRGVPGRLEADEHEVGLRGVARVAVNVQVGRRQVEVAVDVAADVQPVQPDGVVVGPEQQADVVAGADQLRAVVPADGPDADDNDYGAGVGQETQGGRPRSHKGRERCSSGEPYAPRRSCSTSQRALSVRTSDEPIPSRRIDPARHGRLSDHEVTPRFSNL